jgi:hypothetical protein
MTMLDVNPWTDPGEAQGLATGRLGALLTYPWVVFRQSGAQGADDASGPRGLVLSGEEVVAAGRTLRILWVLRLVGTSPARRDMV